MRTILCLLLLSSSLPLHANEAVTTQPATAAQPQTFGFDEVPVARALRILATVARINYVEPELDPKETISLSLTGMSAKEAFFEVARIRGFSIKERNGIVALMRGDASDRAHMVTRRYPLKHIDAHLVVQQVADYLGIKLTPPNANSPAFPAPADNDGFTSSSNSTTSTGNNYSGGNTTSGASTRSRFVPSLPMDAPVSEGGYGKVKNAIYVERNANALVIRATESQHEELVRYIASHDALEKQLVIEAKILEIDIDRALELGLDWNFSGTNGFGQGSAELVNGGLNAVYGYTAGGAILSQKQVSATLKALETNKVSTTVSNARVVTRSGMAALINNSVETPIEVSTVFGGEGSSGTTAQTGTETFVTGVILDVLPRILENGYVDLNINPTVATQVGSVKGASGQELPVISKRNATTSVVVKDGYTVGIGGLVQETNAKTRSQTPVLGRIPILGYLFQGFAKTTRRTNLVILVTPRIIENSQFPEPLLTREDQAALPAGTVRQDDPPKAKKETRKWPRRRAVRH